MMKYGLWVLILFWGVIISCSCTKRPNNDGILSIAAASSSPADTYKKILVIHSYDPEHIWVQAVSRGIRMDLDSHDVEVHFFYMDTIVQSNKEQMLQKGNEAIDVIGQWDPDVIIISDDNAQEYVGKKLAEDGNIPIVFCGVNNSPQQYGYPTPNVTGVLEEPHFGQTVSLLKQILGKDDPLRLLVLLDHSENTKHIFEIMQKQIDSQTQRDSISWSAPRTFEEWQETVENAQSQADAIAVYMCYPIPQDSSSQDKLTTRELLAWTTQKSRIPIAGFLPSTADSGCLCGVLESGLEQGKKAATLARKILDGGSPASLEIETCRTGQLMLNLQAAQKLGITVPAEVMGRADILIGTVDSADSM